MNIPRPPLSPPSRDKAARHAVASTELAGIPVSPATKALLAEWVAGTIDGSELVRRALDEPSRSLHGTE